MALLASEVRSHPETCLFRPATPSFGATASLHASELGATASAAVCRQDFCDGGRLIPVGAQVLFHEGFLQDLCKRAFCFVYSDPSTHPKEAKSVTFKGLDASHLVQYGKPEQEALAQSRVSRSRGLIGFRATSCLGCPAEGTVVRAINTHKTVAAAKQQPCFWGLGLIRPCVVPAMTEVTLGRMYVREPCPARHESLAE